MYIIHDYNFVVVVVLSLAGLLLLFYCCSHINIFYIHSESVELKDNVKTTVISGIYIYISLRIMRSNGKRRRTESEKNNNDNNVSIHSQQIEMK